MKGYMSLSATTSEIHAINGREYRGIFKVNLKYFKSQTNQNMEACYWYEGLARIRNRRTGEISPIIMVYTPKTNIIPTLEESLLVIDRLPFLIDPENPDLQILDFRLEEIFQKAQEQTTFEEDYDESPENRLFPREIVLAPISAKDLSEKGLINPEHGIRGERKDS